MIDDVGSRPAFTLSSFSTLRISRPAPDSSMTASATSATTSPLRSFRPRVPAPFAPSLSASCSSARDMKTAGTSPNATAVVDGDERREEQAR